jgi:hypothetical protein
MRIRVKPRIPPRNHNASHRIEVGNRIECENLVGDVAVQAPTTKNATRRFDFPTPTNFLMLPPYAADREANLSSDELTHGLPHWLSINDTRSRRGRHAGSSTLSHIARHRSAGFRGSCLAARWPTTRLVLTAQFLALVLLPILVSWQLPLLWIALGVFAFAAAAIAIWVMVTKRAPF